MKLLDKTFPENLIINEPVSYFEMVALEKSAKVIVTDSGGVQKEGYFFGTPCVIPRNETEWVELIDMKFNCLVGTEKEFIVSKVFELLKSRGSFNAPNIYGNGKASNKIVEILREYIKQ